MAGQHHQCRGRELGQAPGDGGGQGGLACCSPWRRRDSDSTGALDSSGHFPLTDLMLAASGGRHPSPKRHISTRYHCDLPGELPSAFLAVQHLEKGALRCLVTNRIFILRC